MAIQGLLKSIPRRTLLSHSLTRQASTLVVAEHEGGSIKAASLSAVEAAKRLNDDDSISVLLAGSGPSLQEAAEQAASCHSSISRVFVADSDKLLHPLAEPWAKLIQLIQQKEGFSHILTASDSFGKNVIPRAAALLDVSPTTDVIEISDSRQFVRPIYAGNALCAVRYTGGDPCILTVRATSFQADPTTADAKPGKKAQISQVDLSAFEGDGIGKSRHVSITSQDTERPDLGNARIVVTGGRGLKSAENFKMIEKLAEKLDAAVWCCDLDSDLMDDLIKIISNRFIFPVPENVATIRELTTLFILVVGATHAAVDAGFVAIDLQVGQTGKIVAPELYLAFGVSEAIQHLVGMRDSKVIVAVNKDADAPIFQVADYGLVGDLFEVIPELLEKLCK